MYKKKKLSSRYIWISVFVIFLLGSIVALRLFFTNDNYRIQHVRYTLQSIKQYNNIDMYAMINSYLTGESLRYRSLIGYGDISKTIYTTFPYIHTLSFTHQGSSDIHVDIDFLDPLLVITHNEKRRAVYSGGYTIPLFSGNTLGSATKTIRLPTYLTGLSSLSGIFFDISFDKLYNDRVLLDPLIMSGGFVSYLPGGEKYILVNGSYRYYFNAKKSIQDQIDILLSFKNHYKNFHTLTNIDVGSLNYPIVR